MFYFNLLIMISLKHCTNTVEGQALASSNHLQLWLLSMSTSSTAMDSFALRPGSIVGLINCHFLKNSLLSWNILKFNSHSQWEEILFSKKKHNGPHLAAVVWGKIKVSHTMTAVMLWQYNFKLISKFEIIANNFKITLIWPYIFEKKISKLNQEDPELCF